jgi:hypothetical protein
VQRFSIHYEADPMIESEHDNLTPQKGTACPVRTGELLNVLVTGGDYHPNGINESRRRYVTLLLTNVLATGILYCQRDPTPYYEDTNKIPVSPEVHADRTVTFRLFAPRRMT